MKTYTLTFSSKEDINMHPDEVVAILWADDVNEFEWEAVVINFEENK